MARSLTALVGRKVRREGAFSDALSFFGDRHPELLGLPFTFDARERTIGEGSTKLDELAGRGLLLLAHHHYATTLDGGVGFAERNGAALLLTVEHPWIPTTGSDAVTVRGFIFDVDTALLAEVEYPGAIG